jgi:hypothetical protein
MSSEAIALVGLSISSLITVVGWGVTAYIQHRILNETTKAQQIERDVAVFRERLSTVRSITGTLLDQTSLYAQLVALALSGRFNLGEGGAIITSLGAKGLELAKLLYDPSFRAIRDLLPEEHSRLVFEQLNKAAESAAKFHAEAAPLGTAIPFSPENLQSLASRALGLVKEFTATANLFADAFAVLDKSLASGRGLPAA